MPYISKMFLLFNKDGRGGKRDSYFKPDLEIKSLPTLQENENAFQFLSSLSLHRVNYMRSLSIAEEERRLHCHFAFKEKVFRRVVTDDLRTADGHVACPPPVGTASDDGIPVSTKKRERDATTQLI